jgi:hypothetical protein
LLNLFPFRHRAYTRSRQQVELAEKPAGSTTSQDREGSTMKSGETLSLCRDELIRLDNDVAGRVIACRKGVLWLTQTGTPGDHLIRAGEAFSIDRPGVVLISALAASVFAVSEGKSPPLFSAGSFMPAVWRMARWVELMRKSILT